MMMKSKMKQTIVSVLMATLLIQPITSMAWVDGVAAGQRAIEFALTTAQRAKEVIQWAKELQNWKANLDNYIRGGIRKLLGIEFNDKFTMKDLEELLKKRQQRCTSLGNSQSRALCKQTLDIEIKKVNIYDRMDKMIKRNFSRLDAMVSEYESIRRQSNSSAKAESKQQEILAYIQNFENQLKIYEQELKMLDMQQDVLQKARVEVAKDQIRSTNTARTIAQGAVIATLKYQTKDYKDKAEALRGETATKSNKNYVR
ncbi:hypothetical protein [Neisseria sp. P0019.S003]|uniref:hypothetical protein n=1 Tax=Neisseria sp. P0019.S003 TaxID=3436799 RepID=UPI003F7FF9FE